MLPRLRLVVTITSLAIGIAGVSRLQSQTAEGGFPTADWPLVSGDRSSTRYSALDEISLGTIDRLGAAWMTRFEGGASSRATPVVKDGVLYLTGGANVFALDASAGDQIWRWQAEDGSGMVPSWQGVGLSDDLVFASLDRTGGQ